jgi:nitroreductase
MDVNPRPHDRWTFGSHWGPRRARCQGDRSLTLDVGTVDELLSTTRSVRKRLDLTRDVPRSIIRECVELAIQAPTAANAQPWRWVVVRDADQRREIADAYRVDNESFARSQVASLAPGPDRRRMESVLHLTQHLHEVPVHVLAYVLEPRLPGLGDAPVPPAILYGSIYPAVWSFHLALRSRGLGTSPLFVANESAIAHVVSAPAQAHLASLMPVAYFTGNSFKAAPRAPVDDVTFWGRWDQRSAEE